MEQAILFFCVRCNQLKTMEQAGVLFRTGYYKVLYPLGCCVNCEHRSRQHFHKNSAFLLSIGIIALYVS
jgi:hypothetical protein